MGLFGSHTTTTTNMIGYLSSTTLNTIVSINNSCQANTNTVQTQTINVGTSDAVMTTCLKLYSPTDCSALMSKGLEAYNISQDASVKNIASCTIDSTMINSLQSQLTQQIDQKMNASDDDVGGALKSLVSTFNTTKGNVSNTTSSQALVNDTFNLSSVQSLVTTVAAGQSQIINVANANDSSANAISQSLQIQAMATLLSSNTVTSQAVTAVDATTAQTTDASGRGLTDIVKDVGDTIGGAFKDLSSVGKTLVIGGVACVLIVPLVILSLGKSGAIKTAGDLGKSYIDKMPVAVPV